MLGLLTRLMAHSRTNKVVNSGNRVRLSLEQLETRDCPAAPTITSLSTSFMGGRNVLVTGTVTADDPASVTVTIGGVMAATIRADASGHFYGQAQAAGLGWISATSVDGQNQTSNTATVEITTPAPTLTVSLSYLSGRTVILSGTVTDPMGDNLMVSFAGVVYTSVYTNTNGVFNLSTDASQLGAIQVLSADAWGQASNLVQLNVTSNVPSITNFAATQVGGRYWTFSGKVVDESPAGLKVQLSGIPEVNNVSVTVASDGTFSYTVQLDQGESGTVTAQTADWWGQSASPVSFYVQQS